MNRRKRQGKRHDREAAIWLRTGRPELHLANNNTQCPIYSERVKPLAGLLTNTSGLRAINSKPIGIDHKRKKADFDPNHLIS